jgi:hypothetical protein
MLRQYAPTPLSTLGPKNLRGLLFDRSGLCHLCVLSAVMAGRYAKLKRWENTPLLEQLESVSSLSSS